jgi:molecular chaperone DnaK
MSYVLGIDLGTTFSAAALGEGGRVEVFTLGTVAPAVPSVVLLRADGEVLIGEAAERRSITEPTRTGREFKRRLGDPAPLLLGGTPYGAEALMARLLRSIVDAVGERQGAAPTSITVTHPANYGAYKRDLLLEMVRLADVGKVDFLTEPEAAAINYAEQNRLEPGQVVAVYDFGGGTFDAAVLRKAADGFAILGQPEGMDRLGGIDFDQAIFGHVDDTVGGLVRQVDVGDPQARAAVARLRADIRAAKESLSTDADVTIPVMLPNLQTEVRLTRAEFEGMIRPRVLETVSALERAVRSAGVAMTDIDRILLVGGSSRIPLVREMVGRATGRPTAVDAHPKFAIALGAARAALAAAMPEQVPVTDEPPMDVATAAAVPPAAVPPEPKASVTAAPVEPAAATRTKRSTLRVLAVIGALLLAAGGAAAFVVLGNRDEPRESTGPVAGASATAGANATGTAEASPTASGSAAASPSSTLGGAPAGLIATFAGTDASGNGGDGGPAASSQLGRVSGVAVGPDGAIYITDFSSGTLRVVRDGTITTPLADLRAPAGAAVDSQGNAYVADSQNDRVIRVDPDGNATTIAGTLDTAGSSGDGGPSTAALLDTPFDVAVDADGNIFIADSRNHRVRRVDPGGTITTVAGTGSAGNGGDGGPAIGAQLNGPKAVAVDASGNLYIADTNNYRVRRVGQDGMIETIAGNGESALRELPASGQAAEIPVVGVEALAVDGADNLYLATNPSSYVLRVDSTGAFRVVAGGGSSEADQVPATDAAFSEVWGLAIDAASGDLYIASDTRVRLVPAAAAD